VNTRGGAEARERGGATTPLIAVSPKRPCALTPSRVVLLFATLCFLSPSLHAISDNAGTKNGNFLKIPTDARGVALGDSVVSTAEGVDSLRWNPAGLGYLDAKEFSGTHVQYYQGVQIENAGFAYPLEESGLAVNAFYLNGGTLDGRDVLGNPTGDFTFYDMVGTIGYGRKVLSRSEGADVSIGGSVKIVEENIADQSFQNPALDLGAMVSPLDDLQLGLTVRDLSSSKANFVREYLGGASYTMFQVFTGAFGVDISNDAPIRYSVSGEYRIPQWDDTAIRAGYQSHDPMDDSTDSQIPALRSGGLAGLTMGAGFGYRPPLWPNMKLVLDYAMAPFGALGISHTITVKMKW